jgi:hypothetical protein
MNRFSLLFFTLFTLILTSQAQKPVHPAEQIPILAWYSIPAAETTVDRYQEMKEAGITHSLTFLPNLDAVQKALDVAQKVGIKLVVNCPELKTDPEKTARLVMNHPAIAGYHLMDEPAIGLFKDLGEWAKRIQSVDSKHFCYVNLFPNFADSTQLGTKSYLKYMHEYTDKVPIAFISFDYYPVMKDRLMKTWYENLEQISVESKRTGKPFWAFALTTTYDNDHVNPQTLAAMRLQVFSDLAYGAQGIQYFTYWSATSINGPSSEDQRGAPINAAGKRSVVYDRVKQMSEEIRNLSGVFLGAKMVWVRHASKGMIPSGTIRLTSLPPQIRVLDAGGAPILVSLLEKGDFNYLVVVNKDFLNTINLTFDGDETVKKVQKDGTLVAASAYESTMELDPGDVAIYQFPAKAINSKP